jgi:NAD(P)-dependent dehydrogenase (short-subunit alcohol dehydrogenase family)
MLDFTNKVALITGAASADGLGFASARQLAALGARVFLTDIAVAQVQLRAADLREKGYDARAIEHDVSDEQAWHSVMESVLREFGRLDVLVNNAGFAINKRIEDTSASDWDRQLRVNLDGTFFGTKTAMAQMRAQGGGGAIVNIASVAALVGFPNATAYAASKGGVRLFTKAAAMEAAADGIRINNVHPGMIMSDIHKQAEAADPKRYRENMGHSLIPLGGMGAPDDIAAAVAFLASDSARYITAIDLAVDGGLTAK